MCSLYLSIPPRSFEQASRDRANLQRIIAETRSYNRRHNCRRVIVRNIGRALEIILAAAAVWIAVLYGI